MTDGAPRPPGWHTVTPRVFVDDPARFVAFLRSVFGAEGEWEGSRPAEVRVGDVVIMVGSTEAREATSSAFYVYVEDVDAVHARAMAEGADSMEAPGETPYGDRRAMVQDAWGNTWQIARWGGAQ